MQPSNHLDVATIRTLTAALKKWEGTVIVISHDRSFLVEFEPTHVMTVRDGSVLLEERGLRDEDWNDVLNSREASKFASNTQAVSPSKEEVKSKGSSSKQISKVEAAIGKAEKEMKEIDDDMLLHGRDSAKLYELQKRKDTVQSKIEKLYSDFEMLIK